MKRKIFVGIIFTVLFTIQPVLAQNVKVSALSEFNSLMPCSTMKVMLLERAEINPEFFLEDGTVIEGNILEVKQPKRAKLNASFKFQPTFYSYNGKTTRITDSSIIAKYSEYKEFDKVGLATTVAASAGKKFLRIPFISEGVSLVKGMTKNPEGNRLKSGVVQVYKDSPLSYVEEGKDIVITRDQMFILKFKSPKSEKKTGEVSEMNIVQPTSANSNTHNQTNTHKQNINIVNPEQVLREVESNSK